MKPVIWELQKIGKVGKNALGKFLVTVILFSIWSHQHSRFSQLLHKRNIMHAFSKIAPHFRNASQKFLIIFFVALCHQYLLNAVGKPMGCIYDQTR